MIVKVIVFFVELTISHSATMLHRADESHYVESLKIILSHYPEPERLKAMMTKDNNGWTVLH